MSDFSAFYAQNAAVETTEDFVVSLDLKIKMERRFLGSYVVSLKKKIKNFVRLPRSEPKVNTDNLHLKWMLMNTWQKWWWLLYLIRISKMQKFKNPMEYLVQKFCYAKCCFLANSQPSANGYRH